MTRHTEGPTDPIIRRNEGYARRNRALAEENTRLKDRVAGLGTELREIQLETYRAIRRVTEIAQDNERLRCELNHARDLLDDLVHSYGLNNDEWCVAKAYIDKVHEAAMAKGATP